MKANRRALAQLPRDDGAASSVVAAILLFALFTTMLTLWTVGTLPQWIADREQEHAHAIQSSFGSLSSGLDALSAADDNGPATVALTLGARPVALVQTTPSTGELGVQDVVAVGATFTGETLRFSNGAAVGQPDNDIDEGVGDVLADVHLLQALVVRLATSGVGNDDEAWVSVVADDGDDTVTALVIHAGKLGGAGPNEAGCLNSELRLEVITDIAPASAATSTQALLCELADDLTGYSIDLASAVYPFIEAVERLDTPYTLTLTDDAAGGSAAATGAFAASYVDGDGGTQGIGSGQAVDLQVDQQGERLVYAPEYQSYAEQDVSWEFGSMVVTQDDGAVVLGSSFELTVEDGSGSLDWTLVELTGEGSRSGNGPATARIGHEQTSDLVLEADGASFTLTTPSAEAWREFLEREALLSGAGADVAVGGTGTVATLTLASAATVTEWRIHLRLVEATVVVL